MSLAQEVCDLRTEDGLLDSHIVSLEKDIAAYDLNARLDQIEFRRRDALKGES